MGSISRHITPLVNGSLGGRHIHTCIQTFAGKSNYKKPWCTPGLKMNTLITQLSNIHGIIHMYWYDIQQLATVELVFLIKTSYVYVA